MKNKKVVFSEAWKVEVLQDNHFNPKLSANEVLLKKRYTLISPGTELACLSGNESWFSMPTVPGYSAVSEIIETGIDVKDFNVGDVVFHYGTHSEYEVAKVDGVFLKVPDGIDLTWVPFVRMATVAMTSIRVSNIELGDMVMVTGLGLIGNMASQLAALQGASVIGIDLSQQRLEIARECGVEHVLAGNADVKEKVRGITTDRGVSTLIEATGVPSVSLDHVSSVGKYGEVILLGSPRGACEANVTDLLNRIHLNDLGCISFKGAHEWRYPLMPDVFVKHSLVRNSRIVFKLMQQKKIKIEPLISHILLPDEAPSAYEGLRNKKDEYSGVLYKWQ
ncbi:zinc-dependent alcohol dehydrogenase [Cohnella endophytica]|uniref:zinc-dependent alcohol dehydrogenase n=1 Tax=Cohnella endophytica TaxID=2419778 RepID=UPI001F369157|nr:zinc-binding alcohol dehydrogenase [Cohnella endophytica]